MPKYTRMKKDYNNDYDDLSYDTLVADIDKHYDQKLFTLRMFENSTWYAGNEAKLRYYYYRMAHKYTYKGTGTDVSNYFWNNAPTTVRKLHTGLPSLISRTMVRLLMGNGYQISIQDDDNKDKVDRLHEILDFNLWGTQLNEGIETESWSGGVAYKLAINSDISTEYPIIQIVQPENYSHNCVNGRITEDVFLTHYEKGEQKYRLKEMYGVDTDGSYIKYQLEMAKGDKWQEVPLSTLEETANLKEFRIKGYDKKLSGYKPNKYPNSEFRGSKYGESDYTNSWGLFDSLDEIYSTGIQEFRDARLRRYFPEHMIINNKIGNSKTPDDFTNDYIIYDGSIAENSKDGIEYQQGEINTDKVLENWKNALKTTLNNVGLSPLTIGVTGLEAIDASAESQQEREKVSIRTRNEKIELWQPFLNDFFEVLLQLQDMMPAILNASDEEVTTSYDDYDIYVSFNDYIIKSQRDRTEEATIGVQGMSYDIETAVDYVWKDTKTPEEKAVIVANIKVQNNMALLNKDTEALGEQENLAQEV